MLAPQDSRGVLWKLFQQDVLLSQLVSLKEPAWDGGRGVWLPRIC